MAITLVQSDESIYESNAFCVFPTTPTEGNLLVCVTSHRSGAQDASLSGWTKIFERDVAVDDTSTRRAMAVFAKIAGASEATTVAPTWSSSASHHLAIGEFSAGAGEEWDAVTGADSASNDNDPTQDANSISTGTTATSANQLGVIFGAYKNYNSNRTVTFAATGFADVAQPPASMGTNDQIVGALWATYTGTGTRSETMTVSSTEFGDYNRGLISSLVLFGHSATGGGVTPSPFGSQKLDNQYATIAASRLNGVLQ